MTSPTFLLEALLGAGAALFGAAPGVAWRAERLPCGARDNAMGEAVRGSSFERDFFLDDLRGKQEEDQDNQR